MRALLIEDDQPVIETIKGALLQEGCQLDHVDSGEEGIELAKIYDYDIVIAGLSLPDIQGFDILKHLRLARIETPMLIISAVSNLENRIRALDGGADDYLIKPFDSAEFVARVRAIVRRSRGYSQSVVHVGRLAVNLSAKMAEVDGKRLDLTGKEYAILELLALRKGATISKETFFDHLYGGMDEPAEERILDVFVFRLRKKLAKAGIEEDYIHTVWGRGYALRDPIDREQRVSA